jgi:enoyl-CoA hydratase/carnithine racemase
MADARSYELLRVDQPKPHLKVITLDRPDARNALSWALIDELHALLDDLDRDNATRVVVLTGAGSAFCAGLDLKGGATTGSSKSTGLRGPAGGVRTQEHIAGLMPKLRSIPQPIIAAVNGPAVGGGLALALFSDIRVAAASARFGVQFIKVGLSGCDVGVSYALPRLIGASRAFELMLTGRVIDAAEATRIGLVSRVVDDGQVLDAALALADDILELAPFGVVMTKEVMWANLGAPSLEAAIHLENRTQILASSAGDFQEAIAAFIEKRAPNFDAPAAGS